MERCGIYVIAILLPEFKIASIKDVDILGEARAAAQEIIKKDPTLQSHLLVRQKLIEFVEMIKAG